MKILKDSGIYIFGEILTKIIPFLLLPYLTKKLGAEGFGELSYYQALVSFSLIFLGLSQHGAVARYYYFYGKKAINMIVTAGYLINVFMSLVLIVVFSICKAKMMIYVTLLAMFQSLISVQMSLRQCQKKPVSYVTLQIFYSLLNVSFTILFFEIYSSGLVEKRLLAILLSGAVVFSISYYLHLESVKKAFGYSKRQYLIGMRYIFFFGLPLFFHGLSGVIRGQFDKILIYNNFQESELGIYSVAFQLASILAILIMSVNKAIVPYFYESVKKRALTKEKIFQYFFLSFLFVPIPALVAWLVPEDLYVFFLGDDFSGSKYFTVLFLIAMAINIPYLILVNYLFYHGENMRISTASIVSTIFYVLCLFVFLEFGVKYIPYSNIITELLILPMLFFFCIHTRDSSSTSTAR